MASSLPASRALPLPGPQAAALLERLLEAGALGASWSRLPPEEVLQRLCAYVGERLGAVGAAGRFFGVGADRPVVWGRAEALVERLGTEPKSACRVLGSLGRYRLMVAPIGLSGDLGQLAVMGRGAAFPEMHERIFIDAAAAQAAVAVQEALLRRALDVERRETEHLRAFLDDAVMPVHWVDETGVIIYSNRAEHDLLGYARGELVGRHIGELHADRALLEQILARLKNGETLRDQEAPLLCRDGRVKWALIDSNVHWENGRFVHTRCFIRDVTRHRSAVEALQRKVAELERALKPAR